MAANIKELDYAILKLLDESDTPLWKKKIYSLIQERNEILPGVDEVSSQTVGRHVDMLQDEDCLEPAIGSVSNDELKRSHIIVYKLKEEGKKALARKRRHLLRDWVIKAADNKLFNPQEDTPELQKEAVIDLICDEFEFSETCRQTLHELEAVEIATLLAVHYFRESLEEVLKEPRTELMAKIVQETPKLRETFSRKSIASQLLEKTGKADKESS